MGQTRRKRRQVLKHQKTLRQCGECPITLLCYSGRLPSFTTICRCNICGLIYAVSASQTAVKGLTVLFKPFRCRATVFPVMNLRDTEPRSVLLQLMSGMFVTAVPTCEDCKTKRLCVRCGKRCTNYDTVPGPEGHWIHYTCTDSYRRLLAAQVVEEAIQRKLKAKKQ